MSLTKDTSGSAGRRKSKKGQNMSVGSVPRVETERDQSLSSLIDELIQIRDQQETMAFVDARNRRATVCQAFAESQMPHIKKGENDEYADYIYRMRAKAIEQRQECERALSGKLN